MSSPRVGRDVNSVYDACTPFPMQAQEMMRNMSDEQLQRLGQSMGQPVSREMLVRGIHMGIHHFTCLASGRTFAPPPPPPGILIGPIPLHQTYLPNHFTILGPESCVG